MAWLLAAVALAGTVLVLTGTVPAPYVFGPLVGYGIWKVGSATFNSLRAGAEHVPDGRPPEPLDLAVERVSYWCEGCGAELLLLVRGTPAPPRHCGERMHERHELVHGDRN